MEKIWNVGLTRNGSSQERLAGARSPHKKDPPGNPPTQLLELLRFLQELDNLLQLFLGFFDVGRISHFCVLGVVSPLLANIFAGTARPDIGYM